MDTDGHGFYRREQSQRRGNKVATKKARQNPIEMQNCGIATKGHKEPES